MPSGICGHSMFKHILKIYINMTKHNFIAPQQNHNAIDKVQGWES